MKVEYRTVLPSVTFKYHQPRKDESRVIERKVDEPLVNVNQITCSFIFLTRLHFIFIRTALSEVRDISPTVPCLRSLHSFIFVSSDTNIPCFSN
jgi:hypothetical protein